MSKEYPQFIPRRFHIFSPIYQAWKMFNWEQGIWGLGLKKKRIDELAKSGMTCIVSYNITKDTVSKEKTIKAVKVQKYPIQECKDGTKCYVVPVSILN